MSNFARLIAIVHQAVESGQGVIPANGKSGQLPFVNLLRPCWS